MGDEPAEGRGFKLNLGLRFQIAHAVLLFIYGAFGP
jgi:hypothetical protein